MRVLSFARYWYLFILPWEASLLFVFTVQATYPSLRRVIRQYLGVLTWSHQQGKQKSMAPCLLLPAKQGYCMNAACQSTWTMCWALWKVYGTIFSARDPFLPFGLLEMENQIFIKPLCVTTLPTENVTTSTFFKIHIFRASGTGQRCRKHHEERCIYIYICILPEKWPIVSCFVLSWGANLPNFVVQL